MVRSTLLVVVFISSVTQADEFQPAGFGKYEERFIRSIKFPTGDANVDLTLKCVGFAYNDGLLRTFHCDGEENHPSFHDAIIKKRNHLSIRVEPAKAKRRKRTVRFQYTVWFRRDEGEEQISVLPNHGHSEAELGLNYASPQRFKTKLGFKGSQCNRFFDAVISSAITAEGAATNVNVEGENLAPGCIAAITDFVENSNYIPAFSDGSPVETRLVERFWRD